MAGKRGGMSLNVARALGFVATKPLFKDLPCLHRADTTVITKDGILSYHSGPSNKEAYLSHLKAVHTEFRL